MATTAEILAELEALGSEQTRKTYLRHGAGENQYGVLYSAMEKVRKRIKTDHALALDLWATGNHDARILATMIADPKQLTPDTAEAWANDLFNYVLSDALSGLVARTPYAREKAEAWIKSDGEWIAHTGWNILSDLAMNDRSLPDSYFEPFLTQIERDLHGSKNRVRHAMNQAVIAIGLRDATLEAQAVAAATRIGKVYVDHGLTNCKTPDAIPYIEKAKARAASRKKA
jgi:3-methyladenine DNA glycosylase AlkD